MRSRAAVPRQAGHPGEMRDDVGRRHVRRQAVVLGHVADELADLDAVRVATSRPKTVAEPLVGSSSPSRILISVLLPAPFAPTRPTIPGSISTVSPSSAVTAEP